MARPGEGGGAAGGERDGSQTTTSAPGQARRRRRVRALAVAAAALAVVAALAVAGIRQGRQAGGSSAHLPDTSCVATGASASQQFAAARPAAGSDSTHAIQQVIDAASAAGGGVVRLPAGTFLINGHLRLRDNVKLTGAGPGTVLKAGPRFLRLPGPQGGYPLITTDGAAGVTIADLTADQSGDALDANRPGRLAASLIDVRDSRNVVVESVSTRNPFTSSVGVVGSSDFCVRHCTTRVTTTGRYGQLDGIDVLGSHTGQVIGNHVDQRLGGDGGDGLVAQTRHAPLYDVLFAGNTVRGGGGGAGMQLTVGNYPVANVTIRGNDLWGSPSGIRAGYYRTGANGAVRDLLITGNDIHDLVAGQAVPGAGGAIDIAGTGAVAPVTHVTVTGNRICHAGHIRVVRGEGTIVRGNHTCS